MREPRDENAAAKGKADYLRADLSPAAGPLETPCLVWRGSSVRRYGSIWYKRHNYLIHRLAYIIANGPISEGLQVVRSCHNRSCCDPLHVRFRTTSGSPG
jgi:hypothetical protein